MFVLKYVLDLIQQQFACLQLPNLIVKFHPHHQYIEIINELHIHLHTRVYPVPHQLQVGKAVDKTFSGFLFFSGNNPPCLPESKHVYEIDAYCLKKHLDNLIIMYVQAQEE